MARRLTVAPARPSDLGEGRPASPARRWTWRRVWGAPVRAHAAALAVVLVALVPVVGTGASFSADEGAAIIQARSLARGDGWVVEHPLPEADPSGGNYPLELSVRGPEGTAPFAKHPLYALVLAGADRAGGMAAMVLLSVVGTVAAAALGAMLARRIDPSLARPTLWALGLGSPLLFDGYLVIAHTLGAASAAGAVLCALRVVEGRSRWAVAAGGVVACVTAAVLLRSEAALFALALAVTAATVGVRRRSLPILAVAAASMVAAAAARFGEALWVRRLAGGVPTTTGSFDATGTGLSGRLHGFRLTWLTPSYDGSPTHDLALVAMLGLVVAAAVVARRRPQDRVGLTVLAWLAAAAALAALASGPDVLVPGLLMTLPLAVAGVLLLRPRSLSSPAASLAAGTFVLFALAVLATQYPQGGSGEWGGRYFALGLPVLLPVAMAGLAGQRGRVDPAVGRAAVAALVVCTAAMSVMGVTSLRSNHRFTVDLVARIERGGVAAVTTAAPGHADPRPVLVTTSGAIPRLAWATFDGQRWLLADESDLSHVVRRLRAAGITRFGLVTNHLSRDRDLLDGAGAGVVSVDGRPDGTDWQVLVVDTG